MHCALGHVGIMIVLKMHGILEEVSREVERQARNSLGRLSVQWLVAIHTQALLHSRILLAYLLLLSRVEFREVGW